MILLIKKLEFVKGEIENLGTDLRVDTTHARDGT